MTSQEAFAQVEACEKKIVSTHESLRSSARGVGDAAVAAAGSKVTSDTLITLILVLIGVIVVFSGHMFFGVGLIILGGVLTLNTFSATSDVRDKVVKEKQKLEDVLHKQDIRL